MYKRNALFIAVFQFLLFSATAAMAQNAGKDLQSRISQVVAKVYPASVLMWEIDATSGNRMSAQFSGVVVDKEGTILSAAHVVGNGKTYKVMFPDKKECTAKGLGRITIPPNFMTPDAAMLKINESGPWPFAPIGWSSSLVVGQPCISIAYPESVAQRKPNVRLGSITVLKNQYGFVESSCIMEPGDSGGPLFDMLGRVIGIHSGIQAAEDINYEVSIDTYRKYWAALGKPENYTSFPSDSLAIPKDPSIVDLLGASPGKDLKNQTAKVNQQAKDSYFKIKSIVDGVEQQIIATLISVEGLPIQKKISVKSVLISKSSMIGENPIIIDGTGRAVKATIILRDNRDDLVLLMPVKSLGEGIKLNAEFADSVAFAKLGTLLICPIPDTLSRAGVWATMYIDLPRLSSFGYIGATTALKNDKLTIISVMPKSAADIAGMQIGDVVEKVGDTSVEDELDFVKAIGRYSAGDTITIAGTQGGQRYKKVAVLKYPPQKISNHPVDHFAGGKSLRRDGFKKIFIQDAIIKPNQCGGPVFDLAGNFAGINIARFSRANTVVMPVNKLRQLIITAFTK